MMGLAIARALFPQAPLVADIDAAKREAALAGRCRGGLRSGRPRCKARAAQGDRRRRVRGLRFRRLRKSLAFATGALAKGGKVAVTGLLGGNFPLPATMFVLKAMTVEGTLTGTLAEAHELMALAKAGRIAPPPIRNGRSPPRRPRSTTCAPAGSSAGSFLLLIPTTSLRSNGRNN